MQGIRIDGFLRIFAELLAVIEHGHTGTCKQHCGAKPGFLNSRVVVDVRVGLRFPDHALLIMALGVVDDLRGCSKAVAVIVDCLRGAIEVRIKTAFKLSLAQVGLHLVMKGIMPFSIGLGLLYQRCLLRQVFGHVVDIRLGVAGSLCKRSNAVSVGIPADKRGGIIPEAIDMILVDPEFDYIACIIVGVRTPVVHIRETPRVGLLMKPRAGGKIIFIELIQRRAGIHVIENHIDDDGDAQIVCIVDQRFELVRRAINRLHRHVKSGIVAPALPSGKFIGWHQLDGIDAQLREIAEFGTHPLKISGFRKIADMRLIDHPFIVRRRNIIAITPDKWSCADIDD